MSLYASLNGTLSALQANQRIMTTIAANIANANTPGYSAQQASLSALVANGQIIGVELADITRNANAILLSQLQIKNGTVGKAEQIQESMESIIFLFGQPGSDNDLNSYINDFFDALSSISANPGDFVNQSLVVSSGAQLANFISDTANSLVDLQFAADQEIGNSVDRINAIIEQLEETNGAIGSAVSLGQSTNAILDERDRLLNELSSLVNITIREGQNGIVSVFTQVGSTQYTLLSAGGGSIRMSYTASTGRETFMVGNDLDSIDLEFLDGDGEVVFTQTLVSSGPAGSASAVLGGKLGGLIQIRDTDIPELMELLDNVATKLINQINAIHNDGVGLPPPSTLEGTLEFTTNDVFTSISGGTMFAVLNSDGTPVTSPWSHLTEDDNGNALLPPLVVDYDAIATADGAGTITAEVIQKEFNEYYDEIENYVSLGPLGNLDLRGSSATGSGPITSAVFNLEGMNISGGDATIVVNSITVSGGGGSESVGALHSTLTSGFNIEAGERSFNTNGFTVNFDGTNTHTISVNVTVTDADGNTHDSVVTFSFNPNQANSNVRSERYPPVTASLDGTIVIPSPLTSIAEMSFVNSSGNTVTSGSDGYMTITVNKSGAGIGIDEMDGVIGSGTSARGISHYFGLNDFFVERRPSTSDASPHQSLYLEVTEGIVSNPTLFAKSKLTLSPQPTTTGSNPLYTYEIGAGDGSNIAEMVNVFLTQQSFPSAGNLPAITNSFSQYSASITQIVSLKTNNARIETEQQTLILEGLVTKQAALSGVNIDTEMANSIQFQNAYSANARMVGVISEMLEELVNILG